MKNIHGIWAGIAWMTLVLLFASDHYFLAVFPGAYIMTLAGRGAAELDKEKKK